MVGPLEFRLQRGSDLTEESAYDFAVAHNHTLGFMADEELAEHFMRIRAAIRPSGKFLLVLAGPRLLPDMETAPIKNWAEIAGKFILSEK